MESAQTENTFDQSENLIAPYSYAYLYGSISGRVYESAFVFLPFTVIILCARRPLHIPMRPIPKWSSNNWIFALTVLRRLDGVPCINNNLTIAQFLVISNSFSIVIGKNLLFIIIIGRTFSAYCKSIVTNAGRYVDQALRYGADEIKLWLRKKKIHSWPFCTHFISFCSLHRIYGRLENRTKLCVCV